nr:hypothetical protein [Tanacetum cinerariifolium]
YQSTKKPSSSKETLKGKAPTKGSKTGKSASAKELVKEPIVEVVMDDVGDDRRVALDQPEQPWFNQMVSVTKDPLTFNDLMATLINFSKYVLNGLKIENLTQDILLGLAFNLLKEVTYTSSIMKKKAAQYEIKGIKDMVPTLWSTIKHAYDKDAEKGIKHLGKRHKLWYRYQVSKFSKQNVYSTKTILGVKSVSVKKLHIYGHLEEIMVKRSDQQLYKFKEGRGSPGRNKNPGPWSARIPMWQLFKGLGLVSWCILRFETMRSQARSPGLPRVRVISLCHVALSEWATWRTRSRPDPIQTRPMTRPDPAYQPPLTDGPTVVQRWSTVVRYRRPSLTATIDHRSPQLTCGPPALIDANVGATSLAVV